VIAIVNAGNVGSDGALSNADLCIGLGTVGIAIANDSRACDESTGAGVDVRGGMLGMLLYARNGNGRANSLESGIDTLTTLSSRE
jgi:hypothetical protein